MILLFYLFGDCYFAMSYRHGKMVHTTVGPTSPHQSRKCWQSLAKLIQTSAPWSTWNHSIVLLGKIEGRVWYIVQFHLPIIMFAYSRHPVEIKEIKKKCIKWKQIGLTPKKTIYIYIWSPTEFWKWKKGSTWVGKNLPRVGPYFSIITFYS